jgi:hypothetical protein
MKVELPKTIKADGKKAKPITLGFTGHIIIPDSWTGGDFEDFHTVTMVEEDGLVWNRQWAWVKDRIVEWALVSPDGEKLPTNPNQIKDKSDLSWPLMSFLASATIEGMNTYMREGIEEIKEQIDYPTPENLTPDEFMTWHEIQQEQSESTESSLFKGWKSGSSLVRGWPEGMEPKSDRKADLRLMMAVDELLAETILPSLNLGNWSAPLGGV